VVGWTWRSGASTSASATVEFYNFLTRSLRAP
jgi:hypothetical protein